MPASSAFLMPRLPIACEAIGRPALCASSTAARSSSGWNVVWLGSTPGVSTPPVAITLMKCAPPLISARTAFRTSSGPSASRPMKWPWPPVIVTTRPAARTRGPSMSPWSTALAISSAIWLAAPQSLIVVTPASSASRALSTARIVAIGTVSLTTWANRSAAPSLHRWAWQLIMPGSSECPRPSTTRPSPTPGACAAGPTHAMRSPSTSTAASRSGSPPRPSMTVTSRIRWIDSPIRSPPGSRVVRRDLAQVAPLVGVVPVHHERVLLVGDLEQLLGALPGHLGLGLAAPRLVVEIVLTVDRIAAQQDVAVVLQAHQQRLVPRRVAGREDRLHPREELRLAVDQLVLEPRDVEVLVGERRELPGRLEV